MRSLSSTTTPAWRGSARAAPRRRMAAPASTWTPCSPACGSRWPSAGGSNGLNASPPPPTSRTGPARSSPPTVRVGGACGKWWKFVPGVLPMARVLAGRGLPSSARLPLPFPGLAAFGDAHGVWGDASGTVARLLKHELLRRRHTGARVATDPPTPEASSPCLYPPHSLRASLPNC